MAGTDLTDQRRLVLWTIAVVLLAAVLCWAAYLARHVLLLIYISGLLAIGFSPLITWMERRRAVTRRRRVPRPVAILIVYVAFLGSVFGAAALVLPQLVRQARELWDRAPELVDRAQAFFVRAGILSGPVTFREVFERAPLGEGDTLNLVAGAVQGFVGGVFGLFTVLVLTFYLLVEAPAIFESFLRLFAPGSRERAASISQEISDKVSSWLVGQLLLAAVIGGTTAIALGLIGVPYFFVLALIAAIGEMIPVVGPILAAFPAVGVAWTVSLQHALFVAVFFVIQQQVENHVLVPKLMERQVGVSAVTVIVALLIGGALFGLVGAILAIPTAAILQVLIHRLIRGRR